MHVIATAGHVDHGKSMLVRVLTGMEPDRWEAERSRGMTIDLGFAWMHLPSGDQVAFVDVPGHERFVTNMLAGAGPAPAVMFIVAADEGWKPQSAEHLAAISAFGVRDGVLVITRADLADPGPALRQAASQIAGTSLRGVGDGGIEAVAVSALTGEGVAGLVAALGRLTARLPAPDPHGDIRLWIDRAFAIRGSGTVVTGTLQAGTVRAGGELLLVPAMRPLRIRAVQSLGAAVPQVSGVARVALNLRGIAASQLRRGMALVEPGRWTIASTIDVRLTPDDDSRTDGTVTLPPVLTLHIGAARTATRVRVLGGRIARLTLAQPLPLHAGDRVLLRDPGAAAGPGGGPAILGATILDVCPPSLRGRGTAAAAAAELASWPEPPAAADLLRRHRLLPEGTASAMGLAGLPPPVAAGWLADPTYWRRLREQLAAAVTAHSERDPLAAGLPVDAARAELGLPERRLVQALARRQDSDTVIELGGGYLRIGRPGGDRGPAVPGRPGARPGFAALPAGVADAVETVLADLADAPFSAPDSERLRSLGLDTKAIAAAERAGLLLRLPGNVILAAGADRRAARLLTKLAQPFTAAEARQALRTSRRVVIPLLEMLDRQGATRRLPDDRRTVRRPAERTEDDEHA